IGSLLGALAIFAVLALFANTQRMAAQANAKAEQRQRERVDSTLQVVTRQRNEALSSNLATKSTLARPSDPTVAFRLAEASLRYDSTNTLGEGALLSAFYASADPSGGKAGLLYQKVDGMPAALLAAAKPRREERPEPRTIDEFSPGWGAIVQKFYAPGDQFLFQLHQDQHGPFTALVWDFNAQHYLKVEIGETQSIFSPYSFTRDAKYVVIPVRNVAEVWPSEGALSPAYTLPAPFYLSKAFFDEQGQNIYAEASNGSVYKWDLKGYPIARLGNPDLDLIGAWIDPPGTHMALAFDGGEAEWWSKEDSEWAKKPGTFQLSNDKKSLLAEGASPIALDGYTPLDLEAYSRYGTTRDTSNNGQYEVIIDNDSKSLRIQRLGQAEAPLELLGHSLWIESVSFSPDGKYILTTSNDELKMWDWKGNKVFSLPQGGVAGFLPDGHSIYTKRTTYMEYYEIGQIELWTVDVKELERWANENDIYQLSAEDKRKYGVVE
nr:WD40 repeat domain-containing protein [Saprospiraceae bacterium]